MIIPVNPIHITRNTPAYCDIRGDPRLRDTIRMDPILLDQQPYNPTLDASRPARPTRAVHNFQFPLGQISYYFDTDLGNNPYAYIIPASTPYQIDVHTDPMGGQTIQFERETRKLDGPMLRTVRDDLTFRERIYDGYLRQLNKSRFILSQDMDKVSIPTRLPTPHCPLGSMERTPDIPLRAASPMFASPYATQSAL